MNAIKLSPKPYKIVKSDPNEFKLTKKVINLTKD